MKGLAGGFFLWSRMWPVRRCCLTRRFDLRPGEARGLLEEAQDRPFVSLPEAWVEDPLQRRRDEGVSPVAIDVGDLGPSGAFQEHPHLVDGPNLVEREVHDHTPMIAAPRPSASPLAGNRFPLQPHLSLDKTVCRPLRDAVLASGVVTRC